MPWEMVNADRRKVTAALAEEALEDAAITAQCAELTVSNLALPQVRASAIGTP